MTLSQQAIPIYKQIADALLNSGPLVQENLTDLKVALERIEAIRVRTIEHFTPGLKGSPELLTEADCDKLLEDSTVKSVNDLLIKKVGVSAEGGNKGPFFTNLLALVQMVMQNPALLQLILSFLQKPATT